MKVGLDATPLLGQRTGIGRYVEGLVSGLQSLVDPPDLVLTAFTWRGAESLRNRPGVTVATRRAPARLLQHSWQRLGGPPVEWLAGRVDVFHATNFVLPPTRRAAGIVTIADLSFLKHADTVSSSTLRYRELVPLSVKRAQVVCAITASLADEIAAEYAVPRDRVVVTTLGVGDEWFDAEPPDAIERAAIGVPEDYVVFVGTQEPRKNLPVLLDAYAALHADDPDTPPLVLVGPPGWGPVLDASGLPADKVVVPGFLDDSALRKVVAGAAALVLPSRYEGFGLTPLEALACGTPVVVSDLPPLREVLGEWATYVAVGDVDALAGAVGHVVRSGRGGFGAENGRRAQAREHTWSRCAEQTMTAYRQALDEGRRG
ncbi:MAG TPA: glycosyltransferase family 1 protein [Mycobacteriales bacterium]|nr:glycosyltransferase family 1 protein [Mycobacteriales bacterium]